MKNLGKPESSSDVVNKEPKVLLIGYGWVGQYMGKYFKNAHYVGSDGIVRKQDGETIVLNTNLIGLEHLPHYDLAIIGVPTPMNPETGQCDVSIVEKSVEKYRKNVDYFLIKSTVEIGTTDRLANYYQVKIAMSPEYVGETLGHPLLEPRRDAFQIIGGDEETCNAIAGFFSLVLHANAPIHLCTAMEAEIIKYSENLWIMQRVDYWNDVYDIANTFKSSFNRIREGLVLDPRLGRTHSFVYPNNRGWSGKCLPKDMNALAYRMRQMRKALPIVEHQIEKNANKWRKGYDNKEQLIPKNPIWQKFIIRTGFEGIGFSGNRGLDK